MIILPPTGDELIPAENITDIHIADVIDAVYSVGKILHTLKSQKCYHDLPTGTVSNGLCQDFIEAGGQELFNLLRTTVFNSVTDDNVVRFDYQGNADTEFEVFNYQEVPVVDSVFAYIKVRTYYVSAV